MRRIAFWIALVILLICVLFPLYWVVATSLKTQRDAFSMPPLWLFVPTWENYEKVFNNGLFVRAFFNSVIISFSASLISVAVGAIVAYGLVAQDEPTKRQNEKFILSLRIAPPLIFIIPTYFLAAQMKLLNNHWVIIGVYAFVNIPFAISLLITFFEDIPRELRDAAKVDGAREFTIFREVFMPVALGGIIATFILCVLFTWNEFFIALVLTGRDTQTLPVSITSFLTFQGVQWGPLTAAATLVMLPMLVLGMLVQGQVVRGMSLGSIKG
ncbi:multiple sugar transport system permease protein [Pararhizobium capsulatum DSM 1112]|uniref:Multiple sugar transport system permease protein n=1 Tax=Pararhizobium capsulatum DSM 1112 TaxID=1121113 RepID=A0ABU0BPV9_9HYPH|nr:carbohydrate ABC transporter permease [Pararhizobium capsulatum]MDQ0320276.1 multiple sugar transport system permease protein [Pararhizobium capsulatum DSM 1112]